MSEFYAHINELGEYQSIEEHLFNTTKLAEEFSISPIKDLVRYVAMLHDIGKYRDGFQKRIRGANIKAEHAICGAKEIMDTLGEKNEIAYMLAYCVAGHHSGLHDGGTIADNDDTPTLRGGLKKSITDYLKYKEFLSIEKPDTKTMQNLLLQENPKDRDEVIERFAFFTRYIFSCLTDADFIDTERFCTPETERGVSGDFAKALELTEEKMKSFKAKTKLQKARKNLQEQAFATYDGAQINIVDMPTGSGKTLCSISLALKRAVAAKKKRIIYVIPFTSIIEQTAEVFEQIFGDVLPIVQHHSNYSYDNMDTNEDENISGKKLKLACENYDADLIITTNVQFFQSLYHNKSSKLRKLHNFADSIIILDEIHMMPTEYIQPCLRAIGYVTSYLNSEAIFLSATMPDFSKLFSMYIKMGRQKELITDKSDFPLFDKCKYSFIGTKSIESILQISDNSKSSLIIVNSRKQAKEFYKQCSGKKYHLSTYMTPHHRSKIISEIRDFLSNENSDEKITVISTSLIEAGVDLDFETVFRELAGLDNVIQSGGRCNREGLRSSGNVYVFELSDTKPTGEQGIKANVCKNILKENENVISPECIKDYYTRLFDFNDGKISENSIAKNTKTLASIPFRTYTEQFKFIDSDTVGIIIPNSENEKLIQQLKSNSKAAMRSLQKYSATVHFNEFQELMKRGLIADFGNGAFYLCDSRYYDDEIGLDIEHNENNIF